MDSLPLVENDINWSRYPGRSATTDGIQVGNGSQKIIYILHFSILHSKTFVFNLYKIKNFKSSSISQDFFTKLFVQNFKFKPKTLGFFRKSTFLRGIFLKNFKVFLSFAH